jgi:ssRNA-specific RNase YbeY (16S rRNA maturation enzyme)
VEKLGKEITDKKQHKTEVLTLKIEINDKQFRSSIVQANICIEKCNQKTRDFSNAKKNAESEFLTAHLFFHKQFQK